MAVKNFVAWVHHHLVIVLALLFTITLATGLAASGPVLLDHILTFALRRVMINAPADQNGVNISQRIDLAEQAAADADRAVRIAVADTFQPIPHTILSEIVLPTALVWPDGRLAAGQRLDIHSFPTNESEFLAKTTLVAGEWPADLHPDPAVIAVVIPEEMARAFDLSVGDQLPFSRQANLAEPDLALHIAGIVRPVDHQDPVWGGDQSPFRQRFDQRFLRYSALINPNHLLAAAAQLYPTQRISLRWRVHPAAEELTRHQVDALQASVRDLNQRLLTIDPQLQMRTELDQIGANFEEQAAAVQLPLIFILLTTVLLACLFTGLVASLAADRLQPEWDLYESRGFSVVHLRGQWAGRSGLVTLLGSVTGLLLAAAMIRLLGRVGPLAEIQEAGWRLPWPAGALGTWAAAAAVCWIILMSAFFQRRQTGIVGRQEERWRPRQKPLWQVYFLDVMTFAAGLILLSRFSSGGGLIGENPAAAADWLRILGPLLAAVGGTAILLRFFPAWFEKLGIVSGRRSPLSVYLAVMGATRQSRPSLRLIALFTLTIAVGILAASVDDALTRNEHDRATYAVGGQKRLLGPQVAPPLSDLDTVVWRGEGSFSELLLGGFPTYELLAIDPATLPAVAAFRPDFSETPLEELLPTFNQTAHPQTVPLPADSAQIGIWFTVENATPADWAGLNFDAKIFDSDSAFYHVPLVDSGRRDGPWRFFSGELAEFGGQSLALGSIWVNSTVLKPEFRQNFLFDDLSVIHHDGRETIIEGFEEDFNHNEAEETIPEEEPSPIWIAVGKELQSSSAVYTQLSTFEPRSGETSLELWFGFGTAGLNRTAWYGISPRQPGFHIPAPTPALVSRQFATLTAAGPGDNVGLRVRLSPTDSEEIVIHIVEIIDYFPTLYDEDEGGFVIVDQNVLLTQINDARHQPIYPNERWSNRTEVVDRSEPGTTLLATDFVRTIRSFPLAVGLRTAGLVGYVLATIISLGGLAAHLIFIYLHRQPQLAVLRAVGFSRRLIYRLLLIEQLLLIGMGLVLGTLLGIALSWLTLNQLNFDWGEIADQPPFVAAWDWAAILRIYLLFGLTTISALAIAAVAVGRLGVQRLLRMAHS